MKHFTAHPPARRLPLCIAIAAALALSFAPQAGAGTRTWDGGAGGGNWTAVKKIAGLPITYKSNWGTWSLSPSDFLIWQGEALAFAGSNGLNNTNNFTDLSVSAITFAAGAGAFTLGGNALTLSSASGSAMTNNSSTLQTLNMGVTVGGTSVWQGGSGGLTFNGPVTIADSHLTLRGGVTINNQTQDVIVGSARTGVLNIDGGSVLNNKRGKIGYSAGSNGTVTVTGNRSAWRNSGDLSVGYGGTGTLNILAGGVVNSFGGYIGGERYTTQSGAGSVKVSGAGSQWDTNWGVQVGVNGTGTLDIESGGEVRGYAGVVGVSAGSNGAVKVAGAGSQWNNYEAVIVGVEGTGALNIESGGVVRSGYGKVGAYAGGNGTVKVTGIGSQWNNSDDLAVGNGGTGTLNVLDSGNVKAESLTIGASGTVNLDGGTLDIFSVTIASGGIFNWIKGTLRQVSGVSIGAGLLKKITTLTDGQTLAVDSTLTVGAGRALVLDGGQFEAQTLALDGGYVVANGGGVDLSRTGRLVGHGTVLGAVTGGKTNTITASDGSLTLGDADVKGGYAFGGRLNVDSQQVVLLSADKAQLGVATHLGAGGKLSTVNGANLVNGNRVTFNGDSSIQGNFTNNGSVVGSAGTLSFLNDVNGAGSYVGNIAFKAGFNPGNSPAAVSFSGGNASFDTASVLNMEFFGSTPGAQYDQLVNINTLTFNGTLNLVFGKGYVPLDGSSFALFGFNTFSGSFGSAANGYERITVSGYDRNKLDFSHLASDGTLRMAVTAVPEPESYAMLLAGLALLGTVARRRARQQHAV